MKSGAYVSALSASASSLGPYAGDAHSVFDMSHAQSLSASASPRGFAATSSVEAYNTFDRCHASSLTSAA